MCKINVILKKSATHKKEFSITIDKDSIASMETPYYVAVQINGENLRLEFIYAQPTKQTETKKIGNWDFMIGENSGRIFIAIFENFKNSKIDIEDNFKKRNIPVQWTDIKRQNFKIGLEISQSIVEHILQSSDNSL